MKELEVKAQTVFTGRTNPITASNKPVMCIVDGCLHKASKSCEITVTSIEPIPATETHLVPLCDIHSQASDTLKWAWRRAADAVASSRLKLDAVFALDTTED